MMTPPPAAATAVTSNIYDFGFGSDTTNLEYSMISSMGPPNNNNMQDYDWLSETPSQQPQMMDSNTMILNNTPNSNHASPSPSSSSIIKRRKGIGNTPEEIYTRVTRPYSYAESYHYLIQYVKQRMGREELIRISRALVMFRPSYMSLVAALTVEDLIYMEKCVQRTLLEFEKLITFSGTPTVVWRRTGEIVLVGKEFLLLTQWSKETLLGKKTYIYEVGKL
jgi:hypothetical protein